MSDNIISSLDLELMDCVVCGEPLTPHIIQCENGHITCNTCSAKFGKCHSRTLPIGSMRCQAMEVVVESLKVFCQNKIYGCKESFSYDGKTKHEKYCSFIACSCPLLDCNVKGSSEMIYGHCKEMHKDSFTPFFHRKFVVSFFYPECSRRNNYYRSLTGFVLDSSDRDFLLTV
ncbi:E3 ubiquitin-protein ligase SINA-like 10 [Mercurialis annua]|uniref:E3 ubiquitin-protein ligase SINA-like 10 n=1 Tax=Mercurialis annua TaxID=3986 RepID=UPI002160C9CB|nr:E3 ubiquitin-protein ligase SINA-like 10 [Mercurialis annua]